MVEKIKKNGKNETNICVFLFRFILDSAAMRMVEVAFHFDQDKEQFKKVRKKNVSNNLFVLRV